MVMLVLLWHSCRLSLHVHAIRRDDDTSSGNLVSIRLTELQHQLHLVNELLPSFLLDRIAVADGTADQGHVVLSRPGRTVPQNPHGFVRIHYAAPPKYSTTSLLFAVSASRMNLMLVSPAVNVICWPL